MEAHFAVRKEELLAECQIDPQVFAGMFERLQPFAQPFVDLLARSEQAEHACNYLGGLLSNLQRKNCESIAYFFDQERDPLQHFLGCSPWQHQPLLTELTRQVARTLGEPDAVLVFDPSGFAKKGDDSVGVARQWLGRFGKVDNGQVGVYLAYVSRRDHALVDTRLYLPEEWARDYERRQQVGIPKGVIFQTRHELALAMLQDQGPLLPHSWIAGDDEMGRSSRFRAALRERNERYLLAVPSNTSIRDLDGEIPPGCGRGAPPKRPFEQVCAWAVALPVTVWTTVEVRDGEKGPLRVQIAVTRVQAYDEDRCIGPEELVVVIRRLQEDGSYETDYYLSNAAADTPLAELVRVAKAEHRIEECFQRGKSEAGLADYEVRTWRGWYHHQTLSMIAMWFLVQESLRGKAMAPALTVPQVRLGLSFLLAAACGIFTAERVARLCERRLCRSALARFYAWKQRGRLAPLRVHQRR